MHSQHQCFELRLRGIRMFSTHVRPREALPSAPKQESAVLPAINTVCQARNLSLDFVHLLRRLVNWVRMVQRGKKNPGGRVAVPVDLHFQDGLPRPITDEVDE
jgi:hypothetical protein